MDQEGSQQYTSTLGALHRDDDRQSDQSSISDSRFDKSALYKEIQRLEQSMNADFQKYQANARAFSFLPTRGLRTREYDGKQDDAEDDDLSLLDDLDQVPLVTDIRPPFESHELSDTSIHSDRHILGDIVYQARNEVMDDSWQKNMALVDEHYNVPPLRNRSSAGDNDSLAMSPGKYFGARSLPFDSLWNDEQNQVSDESVRNDDIQNLSLSPDQHGYCSKRSTNSQNRCPSSSNISKSNASASTDPLWATFKALPESLQHTHHFDISRLNNFSFDQFHAPSTDHPQRLAAGISAEYRLNHPLKSENNYIFRKNGNYERPDVNTVINRESHFYKDRNREYAPNRTPSPREITEYTIQPHHLLLNCESLPDSIRTHIGRFEIKCSGSSQSSSFSIFSQQGKLHFYPRRGVVSTSHPVNITVRPKKSTIHSIIENGKSHVTETVLILLDGKHTKELTVDIEVFETNDNSSTGSTSSTAGSSLGANEYHCISKRLTSSCRFCMMEQPS
ncbi:hypothetical protein EC973_008591 [Apophysomyces ossiformis]|uniref:Uncharacterized protein n=1 Tax=Apophysomyces ossiformis TaxID=679940 RepID=A0A8H7EQ72_9FUNG|nr:hypothetical protein EC973_008591 [Apophysomyces ossiformis]